MTTGISAILIVKDSAQLLPECLLSLRDMVDEIIVVDNNSSDDTDAIARSFGAKVYKSASSNLGELRTHALNQAKGPWILSLDADERISNELANEILKTKNLDLHDGYLIPFRNHLFGKQIRHGGEDYKMMRLFKKKMVEIKPAFVHERFILKNAKVGFFRNHINHFSYRSIGQLFSKFSDYALREAKDRYVNGESISLKKLTMYGPHMFYARYIKDKGHKDGFMRIILDLAFAYMEQITYLALAFLYVTKPKK